MFASLHLRSTAVLLFLLWVHLQTATPVAAQMTTDQQAAMILAGAQRAYNEKNYPFAAQRFSEFVNRFGSHRDVVAARYGLALCLIDGPNKDYDKALEQLNAIAGQKTFVDYPFVLYYTGLARRGQGVKALELASAKPNEAAGHQNTAKQRFEEAAKTFAEAGKSFAEKARGVKAPDKGLSVEREWTVRASCDQAEMLLRIRKAKEAREVVAGFSTDKTLHASRYYPLGIYYYGFASYQSGDMFAAGKALSREAVLGDEVFGTHARYLVARIHHQNTKQNEREEARQAYQAVLKDHDKFKKEAQEKLRQPDSFRNDPETRSRLEGLVRGLVPDHVARAAFFLGVLQYEDGRFAEALEHFKSFITTHPKASLVSEAQLRIGFCQVELQSPDAIKTLQPLVEKRPELADQAQYWIGRAEKAKADPNKPDSFKPALESFRKAAEKAQQRTASDPGAKRRRGQILAELAATQQQVGQHRDAVGTYSTILNDKLLPEREDEVLLSQATAYQLAADFVEAEKTCARFLEKYKTSTLLPALLFRQAENSALQALAAEKLPAEQDRTRETKKFNEEAAKRYAAFIEKYPEYAQVNFARLGLGMAYYRKGQLEEAQKALESVPAADRTGELAVVSYNLADLYLRQAPLTAEDAVAAGKLEEKIKGAADLLEAYLGVAPNSPQAPDALLKIGYCRQRQAKILAQPADQQKALNEARAMYDIIRQKYPNDPAAVQALFERAKVLAIQKDVGGAINELKRFSTDPLKKSAIAPMALLHLATLQRGQNRHSEAAATLAECRKEHEETLKRVPARASWVALIQYHHAAALRESDKLAEAKTLFETVGRSTPERPDTLDALLRAGQCEKESGEKKVAQGKKLLAAAQNAQQRTAAEKLIADGTGELKNAVAYLAREEGALQKRKVDNEDLQKAILGLRSRMVYEAAWGWRALAVMEVESARTRKQLDLWQKRREELFRQTPTGQTPPVVSLPEVRPEDVPLQPAETEAQKRYGELIKNFPELPINADARFELAELLALRGNHDEAVTLLQGALEGEKEPSPDLAERIKVRLASCLLDRGTRRSLDGKARLANPKIVAQDKMAAEKLMADGKKDIESALEQVQTVTANDKSSILAHASYREAECLLQLGKLDEATKLLTKFREHGPFQYIPGLSDRALVRLGHALGEKKQWEPSRQAYQTLIDRFGNSLWVHEARYGVGWALQNLGQYDNAVNSFNVVVGATASRLAARAQLNIGQCRLMQKRYAEASTALLVVPYTYDYPELSALALLEAARALSESKQPIQAGNLLRRVLRDHAGTEQAEAAKKRLADLQSSGS